MDPKHLELLAPVVEALGKIAGNPSKEIFSSNDIVHEGTKIKLPIINAKKMTYQEAATHLMRKMEQEEKIMALHQVIECSPLDGAVAFMRALRQVYGWENAIDTEGFFGPTPPAMLKVETGPGSFEQIPWGRVQVPGIAGFFETGMQTSPKQAFVIRGEVKRKHEPEVNEIVRLTQELLNTKSIYKGHAVRLDLGWIRRAELNPKQGYDPIGDAPKYMELDPNMESTLIFGEKVHGDLTIGLFTPIEHSQACRDVKIPLKRGILLYGPYGVGKTLTATVTALKAVRNNWTFIYLKNVADIAKGLEFAAQYAPAVIFAEDIDRAMSGERSESLDSILNTLDGVDTKNGEIITVFTTNHIETINPALLRMGRLDALVEVRPPDAVAAKRLVMLYGRGLLEQGANLDRIGEALSGKIPAFIRETVERAKIAAVARLGSAKIEGQVLEGDLLTAAHALETHERFLRPRKRDNRPIELFAKFPLGHSGCASVREGFDFTPDELSEDQSEEFSEVANGN